MGACMSSQGADPDRPRSRAKLRTKSRSLHQKNSSGPVSILAEASVGNLEIGAEKGHPLEFYDVLDTLGTGGFAVVKRVRDKKTLEAFAMKVINVAMLENVRCVGRPCQPEPNFCCDLRANLKPFPHTDD